MCLSSPWVRAVKGLDVSLKVSVAATALPDVQTISFGSREWIDYEKFSLYTHTDARLPNGHYFTLAPRDR
jgi:hypothetical protein